jgi:CheY-like chemotaxis protein
MKKILFVDDNELLCHLCCDILRRERYLAIPAFSGPEALQRLEQDRFDIVVTDLRMEGMNGLELARAVHERRPGMPVVLVTAYDPVKDEHIVACLEKAGLFPDLLETLKTLHSEPVAAPR